MKKKISWRVKMVLLMLVAVVGAIAVTWVLNRTFLEDYYLYSKMNMLDSVFREVRSVVLEAEERAMEKEDSQPEEESLKGFLIEELESSQGAGEQRIVLKLSDAQKLELDVQAIRNDVSILVAQNAQSLYYTSTNRSPDTMFYMLDRIMPDFYPGQKAEFNAYQKIKTVDNIYDIYESYDMRTKTTSIELVWTEPESGAYVLIRTSLESLQANADIANKFLAYAGIVVALLVSAGVFFATKSFVRPVEELSGIAKRMSNLDFNAKYEVRSNDEIGELGHSINLLSEKLEDTISDLKSANNQLQRDIEQKVQVDEMRKEFLSNVTHELKTPIALIQGYAEGLKDNISEDAESREFYCDVIIDEASKMNKMVKKLLTLNQIESGNDMVELERFDITALIKSVLESSEILIKQKDIRVQFEYTEPAEVWADEYMMEEVVTNYLTNAIHHAAMEKVIDIRVIHQGKNVRVSVFNTGSPIPEEDIDKIWIKFYKVDKARTREYGGSGIGLSIVKAIMESHNQPFGVINHANGVEFWFELEANIEI